MDCTLRSKAPPHHGARSTLKVQSQPFSAKWSRTVLSWNTELKNLEAALKVLPLSEMNRLGNPLLAANLFKHRINVAVDMSWTMSRCTARVTRQVNKQIHALPVLLRPFCTDQQGPCKVHSSEAKCWIVLHSAYRQWRWRRCRKWNSLDLRQMTQR